MEEIEIKIGKQVREETGEVMVRGQSLFDHYWKKTEATRSAFDEDGFFKTGSATPTHTRSDRYRSFVAPSQKRLFFCFLLQDINKTGIWVTLMMKKNLRTHKGKGGT